jgi:hypothetical protein
MQRPAYRVPTGVGCPSSCVNVNAVHLNIHPAHALRQSHNLMCGWAILLALRNMPDLEPTTNLGVE